MRQPPQLWVTIAVVSCLSGCGPGISTLVREKKLDALVCAPSSEEDLRVVGKVFHDELALSYEIIEVRRADVLSADPEIDALFAKSAIFGVEVQSRKAGLEADVRPIVLADDVIPSPLGDLLAIAKLTHESLPDGVVDSSTSVRVDAGEVTKAVMTLGLSRLLSNKPAVSTSTTTRLTPPAAEALKASSPRTFAISEAYRKRRGDRNIPFYIVDRSKPISIGFSATVSEPTKRCTFSVYHHGDPVSFAQPRGSFPWERWNGLTRTRDGESIEVGQSR